MWDLQHDVAGHLTAKGAQAFVFDAYDRLTTVTGKESYVYDGQGRRVKITRLSDNKVSYPIYSLAGQLVYEDDRRANTATDYIQIAGRMLAKRVQPLNASGAPTGSPAVKYLHTDALGSVIAESDITGASTRVENYLPYGEPADQAYDPGPGYTGHATDALTGLTYMQQRYYDPTLGRFLSPDPVVTDAETGGNFSRYWYANNNPYRYRDPDGRLPEWAERLFPRGDIFRTTGDSIATVAAYTVGAATGDEALKNAAVDGFQESVGTRGAVMAVVSIGISGKNGEELPTIPGIKLGSSGGPGAGKAFSPAVRDAAEVQAQGTCVFCGQKTTREPGPSQRNTGHADPKSRGGNNTLDNAQNTCRSCNLQKRTMTTKEYLNKRNGQ